MHTLSLLLFLTVGFLPAAAIDAAQERVDICHAPPGDLGSPKIISVSPAAAKAHIEAILEGSW